MKKYYLFLTLILFVVIYLASCDGNNQGGGEEPGNGDDPENNIEAAYYNILDDIKMPALELVEEVFSNYGDNISFSLIKNKIVNNIKVTSINSTFK